MPASFKKQARVRQKMPAPFSGTVVDLGVHEDELGYKVEAEDGTVRWFRESDLEAADEGGGEAAATE